MQKPNLDRAHLPENPLQQKRQNTSKIDQRRLTKIQSYKAENREEEESKRSAPKNNLKRKRDKKLKKKLKRAVDEFFQDEADEGSEEEEGSQAFEQLLIEPKFDRAKAAKLQQLLYPKFKKKELFKQLDDLNEQEIEQHFRMKRYTELGMDNEAKQRPNIYSVFVKTARLQGVCLSLMQYLKRTKTAQVREPKRKQQVISVFFFKIKFPGYLFFEAYSEKPIKSLLYGSKNGRFKTLTKMPPESVYTLFEPPAKNPNLPKIGQFVRIAAGLYEGDIGKVIAHQKYIVKVQIVPRVDVNALKNVYEKHMNRQPQGKDASAIKGEIVKQLELDRTIKLLNHKKKLGEQRPPKMLIFNDQAIELIHKYTSGRVTTTGLLVLKYKYCEINKDVGFLSPKQVSYFHQEEHLFEFMEKQQKNFYKKNPILVGQLVQSIAPATSGLMGVVKSVQGRQVTFEVKKHAKAVQQISQLITNVIPAFKPGDQVTIVGGHDAGKQGIVIQMQGQKTIILTKNDNQIRVHTQMLMPTYLAGFVSFPQRDPLKLLVGCQIHDLVKYQNAKVGMILNRMGELVRILNQTNSVQTVNAIEIDEVINTKHFKALDFHGNPVTKQSTVFYSFGGHSMKICGVKHVYKSNLFIFHPEFQQTQLIRVVPSNHCAIASGGWEIGKLGPRNHKKQAQHPIGELIKIISGLHKGYQATIVKHLNGNEIRVRIRANGRLVDVSLQAIRSENVKRSCQVQPDEPAAQDRSESEIHNRTMNISLGE